MIIAIDGFSSCGKSTLAKALAKHLGFTFIDTGAMYRAVTLYFIRNEVDISSSQSVEMALDKIDIKLNNIEGSSMTFLNGVDVSDQIRQNDVANLVSDVAKIPSVRVKMVDYQRAMADKESIVMDGRDIGTVVFPSADVKFFITADVEERVRRRFAELLSKNIESTLFDVKNNLQMRDHIDSTREHSPLRQAEDAYLLDNTYLNPQEQFALALEIIESKTIKADN